MCVTNTIDSEGKFPWLDDMDKRKHMTDREYWTSM